MSIVAKQIQLSYHSSTPQLQQQQARTFRCGQQQFNGKKSIPATGEVKVRHVANKEIKPRQLLRQTTVAATETEERPETKKHQSQRPQIKELQDTYFNERTSSGGVAEDYSYQIYQNGRVNEFFQNDIEHPKRVGDVCLVNDHYILVKLTDRQIAPTNHNHLAEAAARRKEFKEIKQHNDKMLKDNEKGDKKLCRCLRSRRNRITQIAPIHEEADEDLSENEKKSPAKSYCLKMRSCWQGSSGDEVEIYQTQTTIHKNISNSAGDQSHQTAQLSRVVGVANEKSPCLNDMPKAQRDIPTISGSILQSSLQYQVSLHNYGSLIESQNNKPADIIKSPRRRRKCSRFETFRWLWRPFRGKYRKTKPQIQAVVYKTYFVKWTKPPDTLNHGYGVKSLKSSHVEMFVSRRCRSATF